ncbi:hypothetical protein KW507_15950 [Vibrio fluvialis]|nr:hypothetical protein [Vibrio fluvialis]
MSNSANSLKEPEVVVSEEQTPNTEPSGLPEINPTPPKKKSKLKTAFVIFLVVVVSVVILAGSTYVAYFYVLGGSTPVPSSLASSPSNSQDNASSSESSPKSDYEIDTATLVDSIDAPVPKPGVDATFERSQSASYEEYDYPQTSGSIVDLKALEEEIASLKDGISGLNINIARMSNYVIQVSESQKQLLNLQQQIASMTGDLALPVSNINSIVNKNNDYAAKIYDQVKSAEKVRNESYEFPLIVYSPYRWGDDVYLNVALQSNPNQTMRMRENDEISGWTLKKIEVRTAVFSDRHGHEQKVTM